MRPGHREGGAGQAIGLAAAAHVGDEVLTAAAGAFEDFGKGGFQFALRAAGDDDVGSRLGQAASHRLAQSLAAAGHQCSLAGQVENAHRHL